VNFQLVSDVRSCGRQRVAAFTSPFPGQPFAQIKKVEFLNPFYFSTVTPKFYLRIKSGNLRNLCRIGGEKYQCQEFVVAIFILCHKKN
jgi:hypothetical protein